MGSVWFGCAGWCQWGPGWGEIFVSVAVESQANSHTHKHAQTKPDLVWWNSRAHSIVRTSVNMAVCTLKETSVTNISGDSLRFRFAQIQAGELILLTYQHSQYQRLRPHVFYFGNLCYVWRVLKLWLWRQVGRMSHCGLKNWAKFLHSKMNWIILSGLRW